jgi:hypothetical protein
MRCYPHSSINAFGRWASIPCHEWFQALNSNCTPAHDELASSFTLDLVEAMNRIFPLKTVKIHPSDKPWVTSTMKNLIKTRQKAFHDGNLRLWRNLRNKVQHAISMRKKSFYNTKARQLKKNDNRKWWTIINKLSGKAVKNKSFSLTRDGETLDFVLSSNALNKVLYVCQR